jgi:hypothetical protein
MSNGSPRWPDEFAEQGECQAAKRIRITGGV